MAEPVKNVPRPRLGRGLSSLISNSLTLSDPADGYQPNGDGHVKQAVAVPAAHAADGRGVEVALERIAPNPYQPRREFKPDELQELTDSIRQQGILQPLIVASRGEGDGDGYVLIAGERRLRAARQAGLATVPCVIRTATHQQMLEWALIENIQRAELNPLERAAAYRDYMDRFNLTQVQAAERLGQPRATIANYVRLLDLCDEVQGMLLSGALSFGHAKVLAGLLEPGRQHELAQLVASGGLTVRDLEQLMAQPSEAAGAAPAGEGRALRVKSAHIRDLEDQLTRAVGTRVTVLPGRAKHHGRIVVEYYSLDDFDRIAKALGVGGEA